MFWRSYENAPMIPASKVRWPYQSLAVVLLLCCALGTAACTTTNNNGNCDAQGKSNGVKCTVEPVSSTPVVNHPPSGVTTTPPQPPSSGSLADVPQTPAGRLDAGGLTYAGKTYPQSFQLTIPELANNASYSYNLGGQWSKIDLYIANTTASGAEISLAVAMDGQSVGSAYVLPAAPYAKILPVTGVQTLKISFQNSVGLSPQTIQVAGNLYH